MRRAFAALALVCALASPSAVAYKNELLLNPSNQIVPLSSGSSAFVGFGSGTTYVNFAVGYNYALSPAFMFGGNFYIANLATSTVLVSIIAGPTVNLMVDSDIQNAFYLAPAAGVNILGGSASFTFRFDFGKRFRIFDHIVYRPSLGILVNSSTVFFAANLLGMAIQF